MSTDKSEGDGKDDARQDVQQRRTSEGNRGEAEDHPTQNDTGKPRSYKDAFLGALWNPEWWQAWANMFLIPVGIVALVIYSCQLGEMQKATNAATEGLRLTREMSRLDQRAWVGTSGVYGTLEVGQPFVSRLKLKNTGKTFARNAQLFLKVEIVKKGIEPNFNQLSKKRKDGATFSTVLLGPGAEYEGESDQLEGSPFSQEQIDNIRDNLDLLVYGRITYTDIFDLDHWTTFCFRYNIMNGQYLYHERYNDADSRSGD